MTFKRTQSLIKGARLHTVNMAEWLQVDVIQNIHKQVSFTLQQGEPFEVLMATTEPNPSTNQAVILWRLCCLESQPCQGNIFTLLFLCCHMLMRLVWGFSPSSVCANKLLVQPRSTTGALLLTQICSNPNLLRHYWLPPQQKHRRHTPPAFGFGATSLSP